MTNAELKQALLCGIPVEYDGVMYERITAIIYRKARRGVIVSAELWDKSGHSVIIAPAGRIKVETK